MMAKQHFLQLAQTYNPEKHFVAGWFVSEKLDGMRALWDGGVSRGLDCKDVPYANTAKHDRYLQAPKATGLWSRYAQPIQAPDWFLDRLPPFVCDGELWMGRGRFQDTISCVKRLSACPDEWKRVQYRIFDMPFAPDVFEDRVLNEPNIALRLNGCWSWFYERARRRTDFLLSSYRFADMIQNTTLGDGPARLHTQRRLPESEDAAKTAIDLILKGTEAEGGEGLILRAPFSRWKPERTWDMLKVKSRLDAEATVIGYIWGRETDKGSKLLGKMGAMLVKMDSGMTFELSGFTDAEREMDVAVQSDHEYARLEGVRNPGLPVNAKFHNPTFPRGSRVTFKYRELSRDGVPKEASYFRKA